jgi:hypothetical protein
MPGAEQYPTGAEGRGGAKNRADIARVGYLIERDDRGADIVRLLEQGLYRQRGQRVDLQGKSLVQGLFTQKIREIAALDHLRPRSPATRREVGLDRRPERSGFLRPNQQAVAAARRIG